MNVHSMLEATAYHEAGHAVVSLELKRGCSKVTVEPEGDALGYMVGNALPRWFDPDETMKLRQRVLMAVEVQIMFAGDIAEAKVVGGSTGRLAHQDFRMAANFASYVAADIDGYLTWLWKETQLLVHAPHIWKQIEWVAAELLARKTLSGAAVRKLINERLNEEWQAQRERIVIERVDKSKSGKSKGSKGQ